MNAILIQKRKIKNKFLKILSFLFIKQGNMIKMKFSMQCGFRDILNMKLHATVFESEFHGPRLFTFHATHSLRTDVQLKKSFFVCESHFQKNVVRCIYSVSSVLSFFFFLRSLFGRHSSDCGFDCHPIFSVHLTTPSLAGFASPFFQFSVFFQYFLSLSQKNSHLKYFKLKLRKNYPGILYFV